MFTGLLLKETRWLWRSYRLAALIAVFFILGVGGPLLIYFLPDLIESSANDIVVIVPEFTAGDAVAEYLNNLAQMGVIGVILVTMGVVAGERSSGTAVFTLSKPVSFFEFVLAKYLALLSLIVVATAVGAIAAFFYTVVLFGAPDAADFVYAALLMLLLLAVMLAITLVGSCIGRSQLIAGAVGLVALIVLGVFGSVPVISDYSPFGIARWASDLVRGESPDPVWPALAISVVIVLAAPYVGARILASREL